MTTAVLPFVAEVRQHLDITGLSPDGDMMSAFVSSGEEEASQITMLMKTDVVALCRKANDMLGKTPPLCSGVTKSSDIANTFEAKKSNKECPVIGLPESCIEGFD